MRKLPNERCEEEYGAVEDALDYQSWIRKAYWRLDEAISLMIGIEPGKFLKQKKLDQYNEMLDTAMRSEGVDLPVLSDTHRPYYAELGATKYATVAPAAFVQWARGKGYEVPDGLSHLLSARVSGQLGREEVIARGSEKKPRYSQIAKAACQAVAKTLWKSHPSMTITKMLSREEIKEFAGAGHYTEKTVRGWLSAVDPRPIENKTGRPAKQS